MYIFINKGLGMSPGKMAVQAGHAVVYSLIMTPREVYQSWLDNLQIKIILEAANELELDEIKNYLDSQGLRTKEVHDAGKTELPPNSYTALAIQIVDKEVNKDIFKRYKSYKG
jgi:PTH2 family peptidyl-tRNA hydrolase